MTFLKLDALIFVNPHGPQMVDKFSFETKYLFTFTPLPHFKTNILSSSLPPTSTNMTELVSYIAANIIEKLGSLAYQEISLARNIKSDLQKLQDIMSTIQAVLLDAEEKQAKNRQLSIWLGRLKDVFHDAMDVLDEFECENLRRQVVKTHGSTDKKVRRFFSSCNPLAFRFKMGHRIKEIREKLEELAKVRAQFHLEEIGRAHV